MDAVADLAVGKPSGVLANLVLGEESNIASDFSNLIDGDLFNIGPLSCNFGFDYLKAVQKITKENTERLITLIKEQDDYIKKNGISLPGYSGFLIFKSPEFNDRDHFISGEPEKIFIGPEVLQAEKEEQKTEVLEIIEEGSKVLEDVEKESKGLEDVEKEIKVLENVEGESQVLENVAEETQVLENTAGETRDLENAAGETLVLEKAEEETRVLEKVEEETRVLESAEEGSQILEKVNEEKVLETEIDSGKEQVEEVPAVEISDQVSETVEKNPSENETSLKGSDKLFRDLGWNSDEENEEIGGSSDPSSYPIRYFPDRETTKFLEGDLSICIDDRTDKEKEYYQLYSAGLEESEDSELPCSSKSISVAPVLMESSTMGDRFEKTTIRVYSRKNVMTLKPKIEEPPAKSSKPSDEVVRVKTLKTLSEESRKKVLKSNSEAVQVKSSKPSKEESKAKTSKSSKEEARGKASKLSKQGSKSKVSKLNKEEAQAKASKEKPQEPKEDAGEGEPLFIIANVMGNADFAFEDVPEDYVDPWSQENEEFNEFVDSSQSTITPKKTNDITKIKGWRKKQFAVGQSLSSDFYSDEISNSDDGTVDSSKESQPQEPPRPPQFYPCTVIKKEPEDYDEDNEELPADNDELPADSAFVCDSLDDFLEKEANLKINYEIPHLYAEVGIKLTSEEIVSRPKITGAGMGSISPGSSETLINNLLLNERLNDKTSKKGSRGGKDYDSRIKRTDNRKMQARCLKNLFDYRYHYISSGGKLIKVAGSYDSLPLKNQEGKSSKLAVWANETRSFDDIFNDLMQADSVEVERAVDESVVLLHKKKAIPDASRWVQPESPQKSIPGGKDKTDLARQSPVIPETASEAEEVPEEEKVYVQNKLVGLAVYPGPFTPLPPVVQYHLRKLRNYRTKIDREWANFATSALSVGNEPAKRKRMILPVICPVVCHPAEEKKRSELKEVLDNFKSSEYFKNFKKDDKKTEISNEIRSTVNSLLKSVSKKIKEDQSKKRKYTKRNKFQLSESQIISSDEKRTRKIPGKYKDTTLLKEKELPNSLKSNDFSNISITLPEAPKKTYAKRRLEKLKELKIRYGIKECKVLMHRMKGLARVAPWCMKHECYNCQPCRLRNPFSSKFFRTNMKKRRPAAAGALRPRNIAVKRTAPLRDVFSMIEPEVGGDSNQNALLPLKKAWTEVTEDVEKKQRQNQQRLTLESVFEESERSRLDNNQSVKQITFNKVVTKLLSEKLRDLKSTKFFTSCIDNLKHLRQNVIELIKLSLVQESFSSGYIKIWYLKGKTSSKSRAFLTFSKQPPVPGAINLKNSYEFCTDDLPKVITEIISEKSRFDPDDYAILHCDGSLWEIHGSVNFTVEKNEDLERPIEETKIIYADEVIVSELRFMSKLHPGRVFDNPAKWWIIDMSQEYLEILTRVDGKIFKFQRDDIMKYMELKVFRFVNIGRNGSPIFGTYLIPSIFPYGLIGPYHLHENHGLELKIHGRTVPFTFHEPGPDAPRKYPDVVPPYEEPEDPPDTVFGLKHLIRSTIADFKKAHKEIVGLWLHDKTMKKEPSFLEVQTRLKRMEPTTPKKKSGYDLTMMEHDYSLSPRDERSDVELENPSEAMRASRTSGVEQSRNFFGKRRNDFDNGPDYNVYLVPDIPNLGYIKGQLMSDESVTINHPLTPNKLINSLKMDEWLNNFLKQKIQFIPKDLKVKWQTVTNPEEVRDLKPLNKFCLGGTHILCQKGLFYMLSMNKTMLEKLGLDKSDVLKAISDSTIIKEVMEVKELGKLVTMEDECNLSISEVLELAIKEIKGLELRSEELVKLKAATEKRKWKLCRQYMEALRSCNIHSAVKKKLFSNLKKQLLAIQEDRKKSDASAPNFKKPRVDKPRTATTNETSVDADYVPEVKVNKNAKKKSAARKEKPSPKSKKKQGNYVVEQPPKIDREITKSPRGKVPVLEHPKIQRKEKSERLEFRQITNDIVEVEVVSTSPEPIIEEEQVFVEIETEVPKAATEEVVCSAYEVEPESVDDKDIKKLEKKLANIYQVLRTKTQPEDADEYQSLLARLNIISRQLDIMKKKAAENSLAIAPTVVMHGNVTVTVTDDRRALTPVQTPKQQPGWQIQRVPRSIQPKTADPTQPLYVITVNSDPKPGKSSKKSFFESAEKHVSSLESTVINGNKRFKIERKLEKAQEGKSEISPSKEPRYIINKPYYPPETSRVDLQTSFVEPELISEEIVSLDDVQVWEEAHEELAESLKNSQSFQSLTSPKKSPNFFISIAKDSGKKICILKNRRKSQSDEGCRNEEAEDESKEKERHKREFVPLTSLNASGNVTVMRDPQKKVKPQVQIFPANANVPRSERKIIRAPIANIPVLKNSDICYLPERSNSSDGLSDNVLDSDSQDKSDYESSNFRFGNSEIEGKRKSSTSIPLPPLKKSKILINYSMSDSTSRSSCDERHFSGDSGSSVPGCDANTVDSLVTEKGEEIVSVILENDDETSWLTMNTEDIEKNFQKLIEPITGDLNDEKNKDGTDKSLDDNSKKVSSTVITSGITEMVSTSSVSTPLSNDTVDLNR